MKLEHKSMVHNCTMACPRPLNHARRCGDGAGLRGPGAASKPRVLIKEWVGVRGCFRIKTGGGGWVRTFVLPINAEENHGRGSAQASRNQRHHRVRALTFKSGGEGGERGQGRRERGERQRDCPQSALSRCDATCAPAAAGPAYFAFVAVVMLHFRAMQHSS